MRIAEFIRALEAATDAERRTIRRLLDVGKPPTLRTPACEACGRPMRAVLGGGTKPWYWQCEADPSHPFRFEDELEPR